jgi:hypothetical protein
MSDQSVNINPVKDRRRWWVALLMLFPTGAGYIYVGRPWRFVSFTAFVMLSMAALYYGGQAGMNSTIIPSGFIVITLVAAICFAIDIVTIAVTQNSHDLRWPQRRKWYVASLILWAVLAFVPGTSGTVAKNVILTLQKSFE